MNMKTIIICFALLVLASCTTAQEQKITTDLVQSPLTADKNTNQVAMPKIKVEKDFFDFGEINQDESVSTEFRLKNIGDAPLLIRSAKGSCGCTVPEWPKEAVTAGKDAIIKVTFNSGKKEGKQNKIVTLVTNAIPSTIVLTIKGTVLVPKNN
ncbi:MAG: hypothetical protein ABR80_05015 [Cryomorphaceae bacterium BACL11 MAG-121015-bin20]|jgi:hypothetical protein|nr:MAG: hypothetical protein ABR80_05015 [Cryomorphaceae bacterium BACL11 MAG-121015-bin20]